MLDRFPRWFDDEHNTTRFLVMAREPIELESRTKRMITSFVFIVRNVPAALYKALGGFATAGVNVVKIESYMVEGSFSTVQFSRSKDIPKRSGCKSQSTNCGSTLIPRSSGCIRPIPTGACRETVLFLAKAHRNPGANDAAVLRAVSTQ